MFTGDGEVGPAAPHRSNRRGRRRDQEIGEGYRRLVPIGYSRRIYVQAFRHERQSSWLEGIEARSPHFGGLPGELLLDNAAALVRHHDAATREVEFNDRFHEFARYWSVRPVACAPYRVRTKGKNERGVGYVKHNAIAGRSFASFGALEAHLTRWMREVADVRVHGTTGEPPIVRFERDEAGVLRPLNGRPSFRQIREVNRHGLIVDGCVTQANGHAERTAALAMIEKHAGRPNRIALGADKGYDAQDFVNELRSMNVTPHPSATPRGGAPPLTGAPRVIPATRSASASESGSRRASPGARCSGSCAASGCEAASASTWPSRFRPRPTTSFACQNCSASRSWHEG